MQQRDGEGYLTTNQGIPVSDNENSLKSGARGPSLLEDFILREKIFHFDHERIPERIVHARGSAAHGYFEATKDISHLTKASLFKKGTKTPIFARMSTVIGGNGSVDTPRDVRGFAVKFYTDEGNWDLVGNNIPVFFIQDAIKFPDLIHAVKMEADRGFPQAATAHDTFWDFVSLMPESMHMVMWAMSDRALPRSLRMMDGFGIHTFQLVNEEGKSHYVKFHWHPKIGKQSTVWDETVKIGGACNDYHRRDLYNAIESGHYPEWELGIQVFDREWAEKQPYDVLDSTKIIPEEEIPVEIIGHFVLNRNPDNFFAETEQAAFCPANIVPGIDFSNDPLLQGRLFSYLDTQKSRLGTSNFHQLPINTPRCPIANFQRDGMMQMSVPKGRANYEPNSLGKNKEPTGPRACPFGFGSTTGFTGPRETGDKLRVRDERFKDHFSQARLFWKSQTKSEQFHIVSAFVTELSSVSIPEIPVRTVSLLRNIDDDLAKSVAEGLGIDLPEKAETQAPVLDMPVSDKLSIQKNMLSTLEGRNVAVLFAEGSDGNTLEQLKSDLEKAGASVTLVSTAVYGVKLADGSAHNADAPLLSAPSVLFDAVALVLSQQGAETLAKQPPAIQFVMDAFTHCKAIGAPAEAKVLLEKAHVEPDNGVTDLSGFVEAAKVRYWQRELA